jgi:hypothetical protein
MAGGLTDRVNAYINSIYASAGKNKYYNPQLGNALTSARRGLANLNQRYRTGENEARVGYDETSRDLLQARDRQYEQNTGQFAGQGILRSGIFATEQGRVAEGYQRDLTAAAQRRQQALQALAEDRNAGIDSLMEGLRSANAGAAAAERERRQQAAAQKLEEEFRRRQAFMAVVAQNQQKAILQQQLALARRPIPVGGGGGGGGGQIPFDLAQLLFMQQVQKNQAKAQGNRGQGKQVIKNSKGRVIGHTPPA